MTIHTRLGLVFHQHQPLGNYGFVFEELYTKSYEPLVACLERHPGVKAGLHYSGPLLEWLAANHPLLLERVGALAQNDQVELLGGGYYEPILPAISYRDRVGQLIKLREAVARTFGKAPAGMWLPERVWEPSLARAIAEAGYRWTILDDVHFEGAGFRAENLHSWYLTEDEGSKVGVFPSSTAFRYLTPWGSDEDCIGFLRSHGDRHPGSLLVMGDDGEKFGGWPTTYAHCWEDGWVDRFFARLEHESHWIETVHLGRWEREHPPVSLAYLPATSYMEMGEWALPPDEQHAMEEARRRLREGGHADLLRFVRGGHWRNFMIRYPEVNLLHKRLLRLSDAAHEAGSQAALDEVWKAQCNCPWWHGVFGGVYLEHIRHANFGSMAAADNALFPGRQLPEVRDWDFDGHEEVCLRTDRQLAVVDPADGGTILHWELRDIPWHLTHAIARRPEAYHAAAANSTAGEVRSIHDGLRVKDAAAAHAATIYDRGMRLAAQDTFLEAGASRDDYRRERLAWQPAYDEWRLDEDGAMAMIGADVAGAAIEKRVLVTSSLSVAVERAGEGAVFSEWNLSLPPGPGGEAPEATFSPGRARLTTQLFTLEAEHTGDDAWCDQLHSASNTEEGLSLEPQGWSIVFRGEGSVEVVWRMV